jgi:hypothetical protein
VDVYICRGRKDQGERGREGNGEGRTASTAASVVACSRTIRSLGKALWILCSWTRKEDSALRTQMPYSSERERIESEEGNQVSSSSRLCDDVLFGPAVLAFQLYVLPSLPSYISFIRRRMGVPYRHHSAPLHASSTPTPASPSPQIPRNTPHSSPHPRLSL